MTLEELRLRDEILQVLYWLEGEQLGEATSTQQVAVLVGFPPEQVERVITLMCAEGLLLGGEGMRLSELGRKEGGRRFHDAFADLTRSAHGACGPDCEECLVNGPEHCHHHKPEGGWGDATGRPNPPG